jgi:CHAT domain-containing protein
VVRQYRAAFTGGSEALLLSGGRGDRAGLLAALPGGSGGRRWRNVHLATHGFVHAPPRGAAAASLVARNPLLQCGLALARANSRPDEGLMLAEEVCSLDLRGCDLAVLSACETGLGGTAGGEGVFGLQRAFHLAGARTVVASLWKVPDRATEALMVRFYDNLWGKKMSRLDALHRAQLWLLREGPRHPEVVRGVFNPRTGAGKAPVHKDASNKLRPFYWAAFVLSGDWR